MLLSILLGQAGNPSASGVIVTVATKDVMNLINEFLGELQIMVIAELSREAEKVADREGVCPQIAARPQAT